MKQINKIDLKKVSAAVKIDTDELTEKALWFLDVTFKRVGDGLKLGFMTAEDFIRNSGKSTPLNQETTDAGSGCIDLVVSAGHSEENAKSICSGTIPKTGSWLRGK